MLKEIFKKVVKPVMAVLLCAAMIIPNAGTSIFAATLSSSEKTALVNAGYPSEKLDYIDAFFTEFCNQVDDTQHYGSFSYYGLFSNFVSQLKNAASASGQSQLSKLTRGLYTEVADHSNNHIASLNAISDCLLNRTKYSTWNYDYYTAATKYGLDVINSGSSAYWLGTPCKNPLSDAASSANARKALVYSYVMAFDRLGLSADNSGPDTYRYSSLPSDRLYFSEYNTNNGVKYGNFYFFKDI